MSPDAVIRWQSAGTAVEHCLTPHILTTNVLMTDCTIIATCIRKPGKVQTHISHPLAVAGRSSQKQYRLRPVHAGRVPPLFCARPIAQVDPHVMRKLRSRHQQQVNRILCTSVNRNAVDSTHSLIFRTTTNERIKDQAIYYQFAAPRCILP